MSLERQLSSFVRTDIKLASYEMEEFEATSKFLVEMTS